MAGKKIAIWNQRVLELMEFSIQEKYVKTKKEWCEKVGFTYQNLPQIKSGSQSFTHPVLLAAAQLVNANINWIYGLEKSMYREESKLSIAQKLRALAMEAELSSKPLTKASKN